MHARLVYPARMNLLDFRRGVRLVVPGLEEILGGYECLKSMCSDPFLLQTRWLPLEHGIILIPEGYVTKSPP